LAAPVLALPPCSFRAPIFAGLVFVSCAFAPNDARADGPKDIDPQVGDLAIKIPPPPILPASTKTMRRELRYDLRVDLPLAIGGYVAWTTLEQLRPQLSASACRLCDRHLNGVDEAGRGLRWQNAALAATLSDVTANALAPSVSVGLLAYLAGRDGKFSNVPLDVLFVAQATTFANASTLVAKYGFARLRPYARARAEANGLGTSAEGGEAAVGFYSGHTSYAFVLAVSSGTVASLRGYRGAGYIWAAGLVVATTTAYLRVAADQHYLTDVAAGAVAGSAFGFLFPYLLHRPVTYAVPVVPSIAPTAGGATLSVGGLW
jgi:membrane-associated phospholipid phosphatase